MEAREIAKELAVACLGHEVVAKYAGPTSKDKDKAKEAGERLGEFYNAILKTITKQSSAS